MHPIAFDVTDDAGVVEAFAELDRQSISVDILINNAGIQLRKPMLDLFAAEWDTVLDTNLKSAFIVGREAAKRMVARKAGKIINIASLTSEQTRATVAPYTMAKGGIRMLTKAMTAAVGADVDTGSCHSRGTVVALRFGGNVDLPFNIVLAKEIVVAGTFRFDRNLDRGSTSERQLTWR